MEPDMILGELLDPLTECTRARSGQPSRGQYHFLPELLLPGFSFSRPPQGVQSPSVLWSYERPFSAPLRSLVQNALGPGVSLRTVRSMSLALLEMSSRPFDLLLTGNILEGGSGFQLARALRERGVWTPVVMLTQRGHEDLAARCMEEGFVAYLAGGMLKDHGRISATLSRAMQQGARRRHMVCLLTEMGEMAILDGLTSLYNRFFVEKLLGLEIRRTRRYGDPLCVALLDVDGFKAVNDALGHLRGDQVLVKLASLLKKTVRTTDHIGRYGGDEFLLVLPRANLASGISLCTRIIRAVRGHALLGEGTQPEIGVSIGLTHWRGEEGLDSRIILEQTDRALYEAKRKGKNRMCYREGGDARGAGAQSGVHTEQITSLKHRV